MYSNEYANTEVGHKPKSLVTHLERWHSSPPPSSRCRPSHPPPSLPKLPRPSPVLHPCPHPPAQKPHLPLLVQHLPHRLPPHSGVFSVTSEARARPHQSRQLGEQTSQKIFSEGLLMMLHWSRPPLRLPSHPLCVHLACERSLPLRLSDDRYSLVRWSQSQRSQPQRLRRILTAARR